MTIINPNTDRSLRHAALLSALMDWTGEKRIVAAVLREGFHPGKIVHLAEALKITADGKGETGLSERQLGQAALSFVKKRNVRRVIADYVSQSHQIPRVQAMRDLKALKDELEEESMHGQELRASGLVVPAC
jgi:hypothetical protein